MKIHHLKLINFRNYEKMELDFSDGCNIIYGKNGVGKTNLVESIYVLALTKSFRGSVDKVLIMNNKDVCSISASVTEKYENKYKIILKDGGKKVKINNTKVDKLSDYISKISIVLFNPNDLRFIKDSPRPCHVLNLYVFSNREGFTHENQIYLRHRRRPFLPWQGSCRCLPRRSAESSRPFCDRAEARPLP